MSQPWIITVDDLTVPEPRVRILSDLPVDFSMPWCDFRDLIEQGQRVVEMIDGKSLDAMAKAARESVT